MSNQESPYWSIQQGEKNQYEIYLVRTIRIPQRLSSVVGFVKVQLNIRTPEEALLTGSAADKANYCIVGEDMQLLYSLYSADGQQKGLPVMTQLLDSNLESSMYFHDKELYVTPYRLTKAPWYLCSIGTDSTCL